MIVLRDVNYAYRVPSGVEIQALKNINLEIEDGQFVAIIGSNGSGKSTLAKHLNALLLPDSGSVIVDGIETGPDNVWDIRSGVGMVFQNPDNQIVATVVEEDVAFGLENLGLESRKIRSWVEESLRKVGMLEYRKREPHTLSGGQKQRVAIAGVLAMHPRHIVLDEPTALLDPLGQKEVVQTVREINRREGVTVIYITHSMDEAALADRVIVMSGGQIVMDAPPRDVFSRVDELHAYKLDVPIAAQLAQALGIPGILRVEDLADYLVENFDSDGAPSPSETSTPETNPTNGRDVIRVESVDYYYNRNTPWEVKALDGVTASIKEGDLNAIAGATGSGKSTLIQLFNALLTPARGKIYFREMDLSQRQIDVKKLRQHVGLVFQYPEDQFFEETVYDDIAFGARNMGLSEDEVKSRVKWAMDMVGLDFESIGGRSPFSLSGGEGRRAAIAGVLAMMPDVLVLDEPTVGLDPAGRREILRNLCSLKDGRSITMAMVSHNMQELATLADRILIMDRGRVAEVGTPRRIFGGSAERLTSYNLDVPDVTRLMSLLRERGWNVRQDALTFDEALQEIKKRIRIDGNSQGE
ncbi:MAG: energy-coupling factor transporter ATPase [bacterium]